MLPRRKMRLMLQPYRELGETGLGRRPKGTFPWKQEGSWLTSYTYIRRPCADDVAQACVCPLREDAHTRLPNRNHVNGSESHASSLLRPSLLRPLNTFICGRSRPISISAVSEALSKPQRPLFCVP